MNKKNLLLIPILLTSFSIQSCKEKPLTIWVGAESVKYYSDVMDDYANNYFEKTGNKFVNYVVKSTDTSTAATTFLNDTSAGADIFTIPHDNLGKLTAGSSVIMPIKDEELLNQIDNDNPENFKKVIKNKENDKGERLTYGVPHIAQSLVYYYNSDIISDDQVDTWEEIIKACQDKSSDNKTIKATSLLGTDGYNNSFLLLARKINEDNTTSSTLKLYEDGRQNECYLSGDDMVSIMCWGQDFFSNPNGGAKCEISSSGWESELKNETSAGLIGGAWNYSAAKAALGSKLKVSILPKFQITEEQAYGSVSAGDMFQSGSFTDCKVFVIKKGSAYQQYLEDIVKYLSSFEIQEGSFIECANLPAYKNAINEFDAFKEENLETKLAISQMQMFNYGIAQPFGYSTSFNSNYYGKQGPEYLQALLNDKHLKNRKFDTKEKIKKELENICNIWINGNRLDN